MGNATGEIEEIFKRTNVFRYRIVNDDFQLAANTMQMLVIHIYYEELYAGKKKSTVLPKLPNKYSKPYKKAMIGLGVLFAAVVIH